MLRALLLVIPRDRFMEVNASHISELTFAEMTLSLRGASLLCTALMIFFTVAAEFSADDLDSRFL